MNFQPGFDIDGVVKDTTGTFLRGLGIDPATQKTWDFEPFGPEVLDAWRKALKSPCTWVSDPIPGFVQAFTEFRRSELWNPPFWITATPSWARGLAEWWFEHHVGAPYGKIIIAGGRKMNKGDIAKAFGVTHFVEDSPRNANDIAEWGITSYLVNSPYRDEVPHHPKVILVPDFRAAVIHMLTEAKYNHATV